MSFAGWGSGLWLRVHPATPHQPGHFETNRTTPSRLEKGRVTWLSRNMKQCRDTVGHFDWRTKFGEHDPPGELGRHNLPPPNLENKTPPTPPLPNRETYRDICQPSCHLKPLKCNSLSGRRTIISLFLGLSLWLPSTLSWNLFLLNTASWLYFTGRCYSGLKVTTSRKCRRNWRDSAPPRRSSPWSRSATQTYRYEP